MNKTRLILLYLIIILSIIHFSNKYTLAEIQMTSFSTAPKTQNGKKWRIGYIEGGAYQDYQSIFKSLIMELTDLGWMKKLPIAKPIDEQENRTYWMWLVKEVKSDYMEFVENAYWSAGWDKNLRNQIKEEVIKRLNSEKDIDLMLAFGTWAGQDLANNRHSVPTIILSVSDPIKSGIILSNEDSGFDHIHTRVDPNRYKKQILLFHEIVKFKKIGIAYEDTPSGRSYAAVEEIQAAAKERNFEVIECKLPENNEELLLKCHQNLAPMVDSFYITVSKAVHKQSLPRLIEPFFKYKVPTFSQGRTTEVRQGVLMSLAQQDFNHIGKFFANSITRILNGAKPRCLSQLLEDNQEIAINTETAIRIEFRFPIEILAGAKEIYSSIEQ